jgi:hypothetical protein
MRLASTGCDLVGAGQRGAVVTIPDWEGPARRRATGYATARQSLPMKSDRFDPQEGLQLSRFCMPAI